MASSRLNCFPEIPRIVHLIPWCLKVSQQEGSLVYLAGAQAIFLEKCSAGGLVQYHISNSAIHLFKSCMFVKHS